MIHVVSTYVADVMSSSLNAVLKKFSQQEVSFHYNQLFQQLLLTNSEFNTNTNGLNVILIRLIDLFKQKDSTTELLNELSQAINQFQKTSKVPLLIIFTPTKTSTEQEKHYYSQLEYDLISAIEPQINTILICSNELPHQSERFDSLTDKYGHIPYTLDFYESLSTVIARKYSLLTRKPYKVIVLDCDETLWGGIIEEDGAHGLKLNKDYLALQQFMVDLFHTGFLLCLCSKNREQSVLDAFATRKEMILDLKKHICSYRINWLAKSTNIQSLAEELDLSLDSFIFIDDNRVECAEVKAAFPEILVINLALIKSEHGESMPRLDYLKNIWAFDIKNKSAEDEKRTTFYKENKLRYELKEKSSNYKEFLQSLKIQTTISTASSKDLARIIQLSQRTNQFNLFPNAISEQEFAQRIKQEPVSCCILEVADKYGDYGLVGVIAYDLAEDALTVKAFFLSCRVLGREIEYTVLNHLIQLAEQEHKKKIQFLFQITERNIPAMHFLQHLVAPTELKNIKQINLSIKELKKIKPQTPSSSSEKQKKTPEKMKSSHDYMLDIAQANLELAERRNCNLLQHNKSLTVEISLLELLEKHQLFINENKELSFIELGIDSITAVLIASSIYQQFTIELVPFELLKPDFSFQKLVNHLLDRINSGKLNETTTQVGLDKSPLSLAQQQLWNEEQIFLGSSRNHMFSAYEIDGEVDAQYLEKIFLYLVSRHDSLSFSFSQQEETPFLMVNKLNSIKIASISSDCDKEIANYINTFKRTPFNLSQAPLFRVALIKRAQNKTLFLFCIHHIIHDGWSLNVLMGELSAIYNSDMQKITLPCNKKTSPYLHFIQWQQQHRTKALIEKQRKYWQQQLLNMPKLDLSYDKIKTIEEKALNARITFKLDLKTTQTLKQLALDNQVTLYNVLASTFGVFLSHYADQNDINFITAASGRHQPSFANSIGMFVHLLLIRMELNDHDSFSTLLKKNKVFFDKLFMNQDLAFHELMQIAGQTTNYQPHAFNQAGFIFQSYPINKLIINNKVSKRVFGDDKTELLYDLCDECRFGNLVCYMQESDSELHGLFEYNIKLFNKKRIQYMIEAFKTLLKNISQTANVPARSLSLLPEKQARLFAEWNQPPISYAAPKSLLYYFSEQVQARGNAIAVIDKQQELSYDELDRKSNQLARKLMKLGVSHEMAVGILLKNNVNRIIAILAVIKAGGYYVPLDMDLPIYRISHFIDDTRLELLITEQGKELSTITKHYPEMNCLLINEPSLQAESDTSLRDCTNPRQLAYIMHTSGSTGLPKGIAIEQKGILRLVKSSNYIEISSSDCIAQASSFLFDAATFEIWGALLNGARLVLIDKHDVLNANTLNKIIKEQQVSIIFLTTQLFHTFAYLTPFVFENLNYLISGGESVSVEAVKKVLNQKNRPKYFLHAYGPTENTTFSTIYPIKSHKDLLNPLPIGKPITGTQAYVLDHALNPQPIGAPGKLYLGGVGVARGYINQEKLNQEKYIYYRGERLYDTNDWVCWEANGNLKYLGRKDNQIKINGYRIELEEIEMQLKTHHLVRQAIVLVKHEEHHRLLTAYILLKPGNQLQNVNLHHYLKNLVPQYMLPQYYYQIDDIPLTSQGKVNKKLLIENELTAINYAEYAPPSNQLQKDLAEIYATLLNRRAAELSINAEFFDLGGNSILALHLIERINEQFKIKIKFTDIYDCASIKSLSERINLVQDKTTNSESNFFVLKLIKAGNLKKIPIVFIHPIGGTGFCYLDLIKLLPEEQPCYLIQDPSIEADRIFFEDITSMAIYYNNLLLEKLNSQPFVLAGYSFGGMLAMEMAAQLEKIQLNHIIHSIIAFDTWVVSNFMNTEAREALRLSIMKKYNEVETKLKSERIDPRPWMELYYQRLQNLGFAYNPPLINKKIVLFKANQQHAEFTAMNDLTNYLHAHTRQGVDVYPVDGNHDSILQHPHVKEIGRLMSQYVKDNTF